MPRPKIYTKDEAELNKTAYLRLTRRDRFADMRLKVFGRLTVIWYAGKIKSHLYWFCECECGSYIKVATNNLRSGRTKSCGCMPRKIYEKRIGRKRSGYEKYMPPPFQTKREYFRNRTGFDSSLSGFFYIQNVTGNGQRFIKYGISNEWPDVRAKTISLTSKYNHTVSKWWCFEFGSEARKLESKIKKMLTSYKVNDKFPGYTETIGCIKKDVLIAIIEDYVPSCKGTIVTSESYKNA